MHRYIDRVKEPLHPKLELNMQDPAKPTTTNSQPLQNFSQCHVGITTQLDQLAQLPELLAAAERSRRIAQHLLNFFDDVVAEHHAQEEQELFPAVLRSAAAGDEQLQVQAMVERLTSEHRTVEEIWARIKPEVKHAATGKAAQVDAAQVMYLVQTYRAHAQFEEQAFLPLSQTILGRNSNHMAALGLSLHMRHAQPQVAGYI